MRRLNVLFLGILLTVIVVLGGGMHLVHGIQIRRNASVLLDRARKAETGKDLETAEQSLSQYLNINHEDGNAWKEYARVLDEKNTDPQRRDQVFLVHEQALRYNPEDLNARASGAARPRFGAGTIQRCPTPPGELARRRSPTSPRINRWRPSWRIYSVNVSAGCLTSRMPRNCSSRRSDMTLAGSTAMTGCAAAPSRSPGSNPPMAPSRGWSPQIPKWAGPTSTAGGTPTNSYRPPTPATFRRP